MVSLDLAAEVESSLENYSPGVHLTPEEFHDALEREIAGQTTSGKEAVLIDVRNIYETRIGKFDVSSVSTMDPLSRTFSDFAVYIDAHKEQLADKTVYMYCTGGE